MYCFFSGILSLNDKEKKEYMNEFKEYLEKKSASREDALQFMKSIGVYTKGGSLAANYKVDTRSR